MEKVEKQIREKSRKRAEIYAINKIMSEAFEKKFANFMASKLVGEDSHACIGESDEKLLIKHGAFERVDSKDNNNAHGLGV